MKRRTERRMSWQSVRSLGIAVITATLWGGYVLATPPDVTPPDGTEISDAYAAVWAERGGEAHLVSTTSLPGFLALNTQRELQGFQLVDFETKSGSDGSSLYAGLWHLAPASASGFAEAAHLSVHVPLVDISDVVATEAAQDYKLADLEIYTLDGVQMFAAIFHPSTAEQTYVFGIDEATLVAFNSGIKATNFRLIDIEMAGDSDDFQYAAVWREDATPSSILVTQSDWIDLIDADVDHHTYYQLTDLEVAKISSPEVGHFWQFTGRWRPALRTPTDVLVQGTWEQLEAKHDWLVTNPLPEPHRAWLPVDIEILWHTDGSVKSSLTVTHDGPMVPPPGP